ncbi:MAG: YibE/F family protein [Defluviitaleaceae bacterium]|nr:YibE/F family protein [Defluviitaleaceae bacterium]
MKDKSAFSIISYISVIILSLVFLYVGNFVAVRGTIVTDDMTQFYEARVRRVLDIDIQSGNMNEWRIITFEAEVLRGAHRGEFITFTQSISDHFLNLSPRQAREGDRVLLALSAFDSWSFVDYVRIYRILVLGSVFIALLILFGRWKGFNSILSLGFTCTAVFAVFIPSITSGRSIYLSSIIVCIFSVVVTLFLIKGVNKRSAAAVLGCLGGILLAGFLTRFMNFSLELTGFTQAESVQLLTLFDTELDLHAIIFAGIIIGAVGAITDMAVSISSSLWELKTQKPEVSPAEVFSSGITIGKDIMGSSINTLVLAYLGSSLTVILVLVGWDTSVFRLINRELVIVDLLKAIVGVFGIFLTMPLTAFACAGFYTRKRGRISAGNMIYSERT